MDYLRRSARVFRLQKIPNTAIRNKMQVEQSILDRINRINLMTSIDTYFFKMHSNIKKAIKMVWTPS